MSPAGVDPSKIRGREIGVYTGSLGTETNGAALEKLNHALLVTPACMLPNTVSFHFDFHGPSVQLSFLLIFD